MPRRRKQQVAEDFLLNSVRTVSVPVRKKKAGRVQFPDLSGGMGAKGDFLPLHASDIKKTKGLAAHHKKMAWKRHREILKQIEKTHA